MYCDRCGSRLDPEAKACGVCEKPVIQAGRPLAAPRARLAQPAVPDRVRKNIQLLSTFWLAYGILRLVNMLWITLFGRLLWPSIFGAMSDSDWGHWASENWSWLPPQSWFWLPAGLFAAAFGVAYLVLAWALHEQRPWARTYGLVLGFLVLWRIPFGTALGIYTLWVLLPEGSRREYQQLARTA